MSDWVHETFKQILRGASGPGSAVGPEPPGGHETQWTAIVSVSSKVGCSAGTLRKWVRRAARDSGVLPGLTSDVSGSRRWKGRTWSFVGRTRSCARHRLISPKRSLTADPRHDFVHRRAPRPVPGRADPPGAADRPLTYYESKARDADRSRLPARANRDARLREHIERVWEENFRVYGVRKVWRQLCREGVTLGRCTVARLMRELGLRGVVRGRRVKTTPVATLSCPADRVNRVFQAPRPTPCGSRT